MQNLNVRSLLKSVRQRQLMVDGSAAVCWAVVAAAGLLLLAMWLDLLWELSPQVRVAATLLASLAGAGALGWLVWRTWTHTDEEFAARRLDTAGGFGGMILSGWELASGKGAGDKKQTLSEGMSQIAIGHAARLGATVPATEAVPASPARRAGVVLASLAGLVLLMGACLPNLAATQWRRFVSPYADVPPFSRIELEVTPGDTQVVYGQGLDVRAVLSGELAEQLSLVLESNGSTDNATDKTVDEVPMFPEGENEWRASLSRITEPCTYFVKADGSRSQRYRIDLITVPNIESVRFQVKQPAYARQAVYNGPLPEEGLSGLTGAEVTVWVKSNRPLSAGTLQVTTEQGAQEVVLQPTAEGESEVTGTFTITAHGRFELSVTDAEGQSSLEPYAGALTLLDDQKPFVRLLRPRETSLATPNISLPIELSAEDDYGVARLQLYRSLNNSRPLPLEFTIEANPPRRMREQIYLPLSEYGLEPGDEIKVFARVEDNDPAGAKGSESKVATVRIISQEEFERMVQQRQGLEVLVSKYQQAARRMEKLATKLKELQEQLAEMPADSPVADEVREQIEKLAKEMKAEADAIRKSAKQLLPYDLDKALTEELEKSAEALEKMAKAAEGLAAKPGMSNSETASELKRMEKQLSDSRKEYSEDATLPLDLLEKVYPLLENQSKFKMLVQQQRDLAERMASLKGLDSPDDPAIKARMRDLETEQRQIREHLDELAADIELKAERLPSNPELDKLRETAMQFAAALVDSGASEAMADSEAGLLEFNGDQAHAKATEAADILESLLSKCDGMGGQCKSCLSFNPSLSSSMGNTLQQLLGQAGLSGMGTGSGMGGGAGGMGGYSARRGGAGNVGLYGGLRSMGSQGAGQGFSSSDHSTGGDGYATGVGSDSDPSIVDFQDASEAVGGSQGAVPLRYRQRVGRYLQELAEELNEP